MLKLHLINCAALVTYFLLQELHLILQLMILFLKIFVFVFEEDEFLQYV